MLCGEGNESKESKSEMGDECWVRGSGRGWALTVDQGEVRWACGEAWRWPSLARHKLSAREVATGGQSGHLASLSLPRPRLACQAHIELIAYLPSLSPQSLLFSASQILTTICYRQNRAQRVSIAPGA